MKKYIPKIKYEYSNGSYVEFGFIKNATYKNIIYKKVKSKHKGKWTEHCDEMRIDEAKITINSLKQLLIINNRSIK